ncbi:hypothetical protein B9Z55_024473 [Caenorhabditis nigoni]|uniref:Uncharacterized protein n=1 Tax=Caenorhabditis nigoni TaxID=1611254 RepID=A0A2G5SUL0_9PELO|nr:hypothetical protein B9Z55_024473 [Caenorhabditis nigoni]
MHELSSWQTSTMARDVSRKVNYAHKIKFFHPIVVTGCNQNDKEAVQTHKGHHLRKLFVGRRKLILYSQRRCHQHLILRFVTIWDFSK